MNKSHFILVKAGQQIIIVECNYLRGIVLWTVCGVSLHEICSWQKNHKNIGRDAVLYFHGFNYVAHDGLFCQQAIRKEG